MPRETKLYTAVANPGAIYEQVKQYLVTLKFEETIYENENVFKKGNGWLIAPNFIKIEFLPTGVKVEGWIKFALLPGVFLGEIDMKSFIGFAAKKAVKDGMAYIDALLKANGAMETMMNVPYAAQIPQNNPYYQQPVQYAPPAQPMQPPMQYAPPVQPQVPYTAPVQPVQPPVAYNPPAQPYPPVQYAPPVQPAEPVQNIYAPVPPVEENRDAPLNVPVLPFEEKTDIN